RTMAAVVRFLIPASRESDVVNVPNQSGAYVRGNRDVKRQRTAFTLRLATTMAAGRATPPLLKDLNERTVLEAIRAGAPISRAEISRRVGISKPTVSLALQSLLDAGLVRETAPDGSGPSYGATFFEPVP